MKLKTIVASLVALGLSAPSLAAPRYVNSSYQVDVMRNQARTIDMILKKNQPGGFDRPCGWNSKVNLSGLITTDAYLANQSPTNPNVEGRVSDLLLSNANLFADARVSNWVSASMSLIFTSLTGTPFSFGVYNTPNSLMVRNPVNRTNLDTAYATIGNPQTSPVYFRVGKEYVPFGQYKPYAFVQSGNPTQLFTEINQTVAQLGFVTPTGFNGSIYTFAGNPRYGDGGLTHRIQNGGIDLGFGLNLLKTKINVDAGMIADISDSNYLSANYQNLLTNPTNTVNDLLPGLPTQRVPAWNVNADFIVGIFDVNGHYVSTTRSLVSPKTVAAAEPTLLGKPKAWGLEVGFDMPVKCQKARLAVGLQGTSNLAGFLPRKRMYIDYLVSMSNWFDVGVAVIQERAYAGGNADDEDSKAKSTFGQLRANVKFA